MLSSGMILAVTFRRPNALKAFALTSSASVLLEPSRNMSIFTVISSITAPVCAVREVSDELSQSQ